MIFRGKCWSACAACTANGGSHMLACATELETTEKVEGLEVAGGKSEM